MLRLSPDGHRYLATRPPRPFVWRWLIPAVTGRNPGRWADLTRAHLVLLPFVAAWFVGDWRAGLFVAGLAGVMHVNVRFPVLVDAPAMVWALAAAGYAERGVWLVAIVAALVAGAISERAPIFAALWAWSPVPLLGIVAAGWWRKAGPDVLDEHNRWVLAHPFRAGWAYHKTLPAWRWLLPWGAGVLAVLAPTWQLAATCAVAYAMCAVATDTVRLYQWAWPVVAMQTLVALDGRPAQVWVLVGLAHFANPWRTEGV